MTTATIPSTTSYANRSVTPSVTFWNTLVSEWTKLASLRSTHITLAMGFLLSIATTALVTVAMGSTQTDWPETFDPITTSMVGNIFALIIYSVFGVMAVSREYSSGMIGLTFMATPSRSRVLFAKLLLVGGIIFVLGLITTVSMFFVGQAILSAYGSPSASIGDGDAQRMVFGLGATMAFFPVIGLALGMLLRSTAGGITSVLGLLWLPQIVGELVPLWWQEHIISLLPSNGLDSMTVSHLHPSPAFSDPALGALIAAGWLVAIIGAAWFRLGSRDA